MDDDPVVVPPEVAEELELLYQLNETDTDNRERVKQRAQERGLEAAVKWLEHVDEEVYRQSRRDGFIAGDET